MNINAVVEEVAKVVRGKEEEIRKSLICFLAGGHLLIEDIPGVGKTTLALALSRAMSLSFARVQFTSDLLPSDIVGTSVFDQAKKEFVFKAGPVFNNVVLADEINRATPKTQSALLEAMAYPDEETERDIVMGANPLDKVSTVKEVVSRAEILEAMEEVKKVYISPEVAELIVSIASQTRSDANILLGVSTRGAIHLANCARALAYTKDRDFVVPEDVLETALPVLSHRIVVREGVNKEEAISEVLQRVEIPR